MKKYFLFIVTFFFLKSNYFAQRVDSTFVIHFNNQSDWGTSNGTDARSEIKNGFFEFEHKRTEGSWAHWKSFNHQLEDNYEIETKITFVAGKKNYGYGIIFGFKDWDNYNSFLITGDGSATITSETDGKYNELMKWKQFGSINSMSPNVLKIVRADKNIIFYINDEEIYKTKVSKAPLHSLKHGFIIYNQINIKADYFSVHGKYNRIKLVPDAFKGYKKENLGTAVNSSVPDLCPRVSADGKSLYFFRKRHKENLGTDGKDDIWYSNLQADGTWSKAKNISKPINNSGHNFIISIMSDNNHMLVSNTYNSDGSPKSEGFSISERTADGWSLPKEVKVTDYYTDAENTSSCLSHDQQILIMSLQRKDSKDHQDLYVSFKNIYSGNYSEPKNLGKVVNTMGAEVTPFLATDNKTLYFSSDGHAGYGSNDIFVTKRLDDTWENWSEPLNLGPEINGADWDAYFSIPASGDFAYMTEINGDMENDIVRIQLNESAKPNPVALITGVVYNKKDNSVLGARINYVDLETNKVVGDATSDPVTGAYTIILEYGKKYSFRADKDGFYAVNDYLDLTDVKSYQEVKKDLYLVPIEVGQIVRLNNIFFDLNKSDIKSESAEELDRLVEFLNKNKTVTIEISGHTDDQGADAYNKNLSQQRAESVVNYLIEKSIDKTRLSSKGYGESKPLVKNDSEENRAINRRVEFTILKQ